MYIVCFYGAVIRIGRGERKRNIMCHILPLCAKLRLLWQPDFGPIPVAMVEKDGVVMMIIQQQNIPAF